MTVSGPPTRRTKLLPRTGGNRSTLARCGVAALVWVAMLGLSVGLGHYLRGGPYSFFWISILFAAWYAGLLPAVILTVASALAANFFITTPLHALSFSDPGALVSMAAFLVAALTAAFAVSRVATDRARAAAAELELELSNEELATQNASLAEQQAELEHQTEQAQMLAADVEHSNEQLRLAAVEAEQVRIQLASVLDSLSDLVASYDAEWRWTFANPAARAALRALGKDPDAVMGRVVWEELPQLVGTRFETETRRAQTEGRVVEYEEYLPDLDLWFENRIVPGPDGGVTSYSRDVTERRRAVERLLRSEARYRALTEASTQMVWHTTANGLVEDMPRWRELTGQAPEEVRGAGWADAVWPEDRERVMRVWAQAHSARAVYECEYRLRLRDGSTRWFRARAVPVIEPDGTLVEWVGVFDDVDQERRADQARTFLERASGALAAGGDVRTTLAAVARIATEPIADDERARDPERYGLPEAFADGVAIDLPRPGGGFDRVAVESVDPAKRDLVDQIERDYPTPEDAPAGYAYVIRTGESQLFELLGSEVLESLARDDRHLAMLQALDMYSSIVVPLRARGEVLGAVTFVLHGPGRRHPYGTRELATAEELARRAGAALDNALRYAEAEKERARAETASRAKSEFLATMSHELRTPLNAMIGYSDLLMLGIPEAIGPGAQQQIERIALAARHLLSIIDEILTFSRIEAGREDLRIEAVDLEEVVREVAAIVEPLAAEKGLSLDLPDPSTLPALRTDPRKLRQILINLLGNAVKFTERGEVAFTIEQRGGSVAFQVRDTGVGIQRSDVNHIFDPFWQADNSLTRDIGGTGLGLTVSLELARRLGGDLHVQSEPGVGSIFTLSVPQGIQMPDPHTDRTQTAGSLRG